MSALECADLQNSATSGLAAQTDQPDGSSVLPPFSGNLSVDEGLKLSNDNFKQLIKNSLKTNITLASQVQRKPAFPTPNLLAHLASKANLASNWGYFFKGIVVPPLSQLTATPPFPTCHVLAQFAYKAYEDDKEGETDAQYETRLDLPDGWKLLTRASNDSNTNGYFGAAYWHPKHQQVVVAHRGTKLTNLGALWTDLVGVLFKHHVPQMRSASTFAHKVVEVLGEVKQEHGVSFQLFFTGHSLGGWLAQVTTFTTDYLKREGKFFLRSKEDNYCYHPHAVVFESRGCKNMLSQMTDELDVRLDGRYIDLELLDITSYLSAPNRINTCNAHLGTVYRIFPDFSDMSWLGKHTALYNLEAHSMQKIVDFFQTKEGQIHKDEQGKLKILVVIDWPICAAFRRSEEYKRFFQEAKHLNDYHQEVTDVTFQIEGYHPMRYQTKPYDERVSSLSVFCRQERQFLVSYGWLRQLPEFFKLKELFSKIKDNQAQEQAVNILKGFEVEVENDKISCTKGSKLRTLIPYVQRLLELFPEIKENTTRALSSDEVRNRVYQFETRRYVERISQSPLQFKSDDSNFREFLEGGKQKLLHLQVVKGEAWTRLIKVHQDLQKTGCLSEVQYTILKLKRLLKVNQFMDFSKLMQSRVTPHLLLMACEDNQQMDEESKDIIRSLFDTIKQKRNIKIIFITRSEGSTVAFLHHMGWRISGEGFVRRVEELTWSDLTASSQKKLLEKSVQFQGAKISLNEIMAAESPVANVLPLGALLEEKELEIADPLPIYNAYNPSCYIERAFRHQIAIHLDIHTDSRKQKFRDLLAGSEHEFKQLCQLNPKSNVHLLVTEKSGKLVWQQSQGSLEILREYIDTENSQTYTADDLDKLLDQAQHQRLMLISGTAGMGKSTILTHLSKQIKQKFPAKWVVRINLNDHTDVLKELEQEQIDKEKAIEFISEKLLKLKPGLEVKLFKQCCEQKQKVRIVIMLDGVDEISPYYKETFMDLLQALRQTEVEQLWVTTRPHLREELEDKLQQLSYTLETFSDKDQVEFLTKFWGLKDWFTEPEEKEEDRKKKKLEIYAEHLIKRLAQSIRDKDKQFTGIPLQTRMLAEAFDDEAKTFCQSVESTPELPLELDLLGLYERFIERKYDIYQEEKFRVPADNVVAKEQRQRDLKSMREDHQLWALKVLFPKEQVALIQNNRECTFSAEQLTRIGIVQLSHEDKPHFIHRIFAEYYVADYLVNHLTEGNNSSQEVQSFILNDILQEAECRVIRVFIDAFLSRSQPSVQVIKHYGSRIHELGRDHVRILLNVAVEGDANIIGFLLDCLLEAGDRISATKMSNLADSRVLGESWPNAHRWELYKKYLNLRWPEMCNRTAKNMSLNCTGSDEETAWQETEELGKPDDLREIWEWAEENLTREEINNNFLLATDNAEGTLWHVAANEGNLFILQKTWEWAKENLTKEEINNKLLLATGNMGKTAWHVAAQAGEIDIMQKIWEWAKENLTKGEINNKLLLAKDDLGKTALHVAANDGELYVLQKVWECAKENLTKEEINNKMLFAREIDEKTAWHVAAQAGKLDILQKIWEWAKENLTKEELNNKLLLAKGYYGETAWHSAAGAGSLDTFQKIWEWATENLTKEEINNKLLLATDYGGKTTLHLAAHSWSLHVLPKIWELAKENLTKEEIIDKLLLAKDSYGQTAWHHAAEWGELEIMQKIWEWAKENLTKEEINNKLLLDTDCEGKTTLHVAANSGKPYALEKIWELAKENLTKEEINNKLLLATDNMRKTVWHMAAEAGELDILQEIWEWAEENGTQGEINNKLLLAKDGMGKTAWHMAAEAGKLDILQKIWEKAKQNLRKEEINNKLLLAKDDMGKTAWHMAAEAGELDLLQKIWEWAKENLTKEEINNKLLLDKDSKGKTTLHVAANSGKLNILQKIWELAKENLTKEEINNKLLLAKDDMGKTSWHMAAEADELDILQKIWELAKENLTKEDINNIFLLATDDMGKTAWHRAAEAGKLDILQKIWELAKENLKKEAKNNNLLLARDDMGKTAWHMAAEAGELDILQKIWEWAKENLTKEEINNKLLLATDYKGKNTLHLAANGGRLCVLQKIWEWAKENVTKEEINNKLLLAKDDMRKTAWHVAAEAGKLEILQKIWDWAKENLTKEEINNELLLARDDMRKTAWHMAAEVGELDIMQKIWEWAKENLTTEEINNKLLLAKDSKGKNTLHVAANSGKLYVLQKIWELAKENVTKEEINNKLLLAKDDMGRTAWHRAAEAGELDIMQKILEWAKENLTTEEINNNFLLARDKRGNIILHTLTDRICWSV